MHEIYAAVSKKLKFLSVQLYMDVYRVNIILWMIYVFVMACLFTISAIQKYKALKVGLKLTKALLGEWGKEFTDSTIENKILEKNTGFIIYHKKVRCF